MGCLSEPARLTAASGEECGTAQMFLVLKYLSLQMILLLHSTASLRCSGSAMQTKGPTVHPRDSIPSLVLSTLLWWGLVFKFSVSSNIQNLFRNLKFLKSFPLTFSGKGFPCRFSAVPWELRTGENKFLFFLVFLTTFCLFLTLSFPEFIFPPLQKLELITSQAMRAGFSGGMVVDYPNSSKAKKSEAFYFPLRPS